jgi:hypothetical protein
MLSSGMSGRRRGRMRHTTTATTFFSFSHLSSSLCLSNFASLSVAGMEVGKLVLVTPWVDALREGYSSLEPLVRWVLSELDGWTLLLATLYAPFFLTFAIYVINDYSRYVQSSSSLNSLSLSRSIFQMRMFCCVVIVQEDGDDEGRGDDDDELHCRRRLPRGEVSVNESVTRVQNGRGGGYDGGG